MEKIKIPDVANLDNLKQQMPIDYQQHVSRTFFWVSEPIDALLTQQAPEQAEAVETALSKYLAERFNLTALNFKKEDD